jgi:hypothetical protein
VYGSDGTITVPSPWLPGRDGSLSRIVIDRPGLPPEEALIRPTDDLYVHEAETVSRCVLEGRKQHLLMGWDESLANMHTLDRWRGTVGLHYDEDKPPPAASGGPADGAALEPATGL